MIDLMVYRGGSVFFGVLFVVCGVIFLAAMP